MNRPEALESVDVLSHTEPTDGVVGNACVGVVGEAHRPDLRRLITNRDYWRFAKSERHFNETQAGIRHHAATWMLAAFTAIAILLKSDDKVT